MRESSYDFSFGVVNRLPRIMAICSSRESASTPEMSTFDSFHGHGDSVFP
jgi:hypothetical protein